VSLATARSQWPTRSQRDLAPYQGEYLDARNLWAGMGRPQGHRGALFISDTIIPIAAVVLYMSPYDKLYPTLWFLIPKLSPMCVECDSAPSFQRQFVKTTWFQKRSKTRCISTAVKVYLISAQEHGIGVSCAVDQIKNADQNAPLCRWYAEIKKQSSPLYVESAALSNHLTNRVR
jgi:hypothetical protein